MKEMVMKARAAADDKVAFGFWIYLMTDCLIFASLFATYLVQKPAVAGGPSSNDIFDLPFVLIETVVLLVSSFVCGLMLIAAQSKKRSLTLLGLAIVGLLGFVFIAMELTEFTHLVQEGNGWQRSGFLTGFFVLVGTHGLHITIGLLWLLVMVVRVLRVGLTVAVVRKLTLFSLFWHFLDVIWIFIFTLVYMMGAL